MRDSSNHVNVIVLLERMPTHIGIVTSLEFFDTGEVLYCDTVTYLVPCCALQ